MLNDLQDLRPQYLWAIILFIDVCIDLETSITNTETTVYTYSYCCFVILHLLYHYEIF